MRPKTKAVCFQQSRCCAEYRWARRDSSREVARHGVGSDSTAFLRARGAPQSGSNSNRLSRAAADATAAPAAAVAVTGTRRRWILLMPLLWVVLRRGEITEWHVLSFGA